MNGMIYVSITQTLTCGAHTQTFPKAFRDPRARVLPFFMSAAMIPRERESFETPCYTVEPDVPLDLISSATCYKGSMNQVADHLSVVVTDAFGLF